MMQECKDDKILIISKFKMIIEIAANFNISKNN